jgi:hypothetical protein
MQSVDFTGCCVWTGMISVLVPFLLGHSVAAHSAGEGGGGDVGTHTWLLRCGEARNCLEPDLHLWVVQL